MSSQRTEVAALPNEFDLVVLTHDIAEHRLRRSDVGAVVHRYGEVAVFEMEFVTADGTTIAVLTLGQDDVRPMSGQEILHVRSLAATSA